MVEFQPSSWSKGSYLNVAAHWLWSEIGCISFDFGGRLTSLEDYQSDEQFAGAAGRLAEMAADEARRLFKSFSSLEDAADILLREVRTLSVISSGYPGWPEYHAGVALALVGRSADALKMFASILERSAPSGSVVHPAAERMSRLVFEPLVLKHEVSVLIAR